MKISELPLVLLVNVLSLLGIPDIGAAARVSKQFSCAANDESLWEKLAVRRYGSRVAHATRSLYDSYKLMMQDDNRLGALPTLQGGLWKSTAWRHNDSRHFYCCLIVCIKWHRASNKILLYLDARGESDLRRPQTSGIWLREPESNNIVQLEDRIRPNANGAVYIGDLLGIPRHNVREYEFVRDPADAPRNGRYKGVLQIEAHIFSRAGSYQFCYANANPSVFKDYSECTLFTLADEKNALMAAFDSFSLESDYPFAADTVTSWNERWAPHLALDTPPLKNVLGPWPECIGMTGEAAAAHIRSQNADLRVSVIPHGGAILLYFCPSEVRFWVNREGIVETAPKRG
jgi:Potato inhibitor I family/F-box domain